jgi:peptidoglycan-N-acetylglucosamine deacetylase
MATSRRKPIGSLSIDIDNQWSYMKTHGDEGWEAMPSYLDILVPRVVDVMKDLNLKITFFIVGQDAVLEKNAAALRMITATGHDVGNHSFHHEPWLHLYTDEQVEEEIASAEKAIEKVTGRRPICFRGPGFSISKTVLKVLSRRGYICDASTFPTFLGPLARAYYFMTSKLDKEELAQRKALFGKMTDGFRPLKPYRLNLDGQDTQLLEIPVTTMPIVKIPIHVSYLLYLGVFSPFLAVLYFKVAVLMCRLMGVQLSLLLHPLDFMGCDDVPELAFFPAMNLPSHRKVQMVHRILRIFSKHYTVLTLEQHAQEVRQAPKLPLVAPSAIALS